MADLGLTKLFRGGKHFFFLKLTHCFKPHVLKIEEKIKIGCKTWKIEKKCWCASSNISMSTQCVQYFGNTNLYIYMKIV